MSRPAAQWLSRSELSAAVSRVVVDRELTWVECAAAYPLEAICETITVQTKELIDVVSDLPDEAFNAQPDDAAVAMTSGPPVKSSVTLPRCS